MASSTGHTESAVIFDHITERARQLAATDYAAPSHDLPDALTALDYSQYRAIRFKPDAALWKGESLFEVQFFHPGFIYNEPLPIQVVDSAGNSQPFPFDPALFSYDPPAGVISTDGQTVNGYAGFRVHYPLNNSQYKDEFIVFQGASYFRLVGPGQVYGLSARGIAIDTAEPGGEEFPSFREFWLLKPGADDNHLVIIALLDSPSLTGAYRFELYPGLPTTATVEARLFARRDIHKLGIAPLTSMFFHGENHTRFYDDFRPEVHDSDGLLIHNSMGEWIWRPLTNPGQLKVTSSTDTNPRGFGLMQRDRDMDNYLDLEASYDRRPSLWVVPESEWGQGRVELVEIPTDTETNDNIVAYWVPAQPLLAGQERRFRYRLESLDSPPHHAGRALVLRTRIGWGAVPGQANPPPPAKRQFVVDFTGGGLTNLTAAADIKANLQASSGDITDLVVHKLPDQPVWRATFKLMPAEELPADMRLFLEFHGQRVSEVWNYVWFPDALH